MADNPSAGFNTEGRNCWAVHFSLRQFGAMDSLRYVPPPPLSALNRPELEALLTEVLGEVSALKQTVVGLREELPD